MHLYKDTFLAFVLLFFGSSVALEVVILAVLSLCSRPLGGASFVVTDHLLSPYGMWSTMYI